jgi:hypothetical protein
VKAQAEGKIVVLADSLNGRLLGEVSVKAQDGWQVVRSRIKKIRGVHALYMRFQPVGTALPDNTGQKPEPWLLIDWFQFN